jgi:hypothetical protein
MRFVIVSSNAEKIIMIIFSAVVLKNSISIRRVRTALIITVFHYQRLKPVLQYSVFQQAAFICFPL